VTRVANAIYGYLAVEVVREARDGAIYGIGTSVSAARRDASTWSGDDTAQYAYLPATRRLLHEVRQRGTGVVWTVRDGVADLAGDDEQIVHWSWLESIDEHDPEPDSDVSEEVMP